MLFDVSIPVPDEVKEISRMVRLGIFKGGKRRKWIIEKYKQMQAGDSMQCNRENLQHIVAVVLGGDPVGAQYNFYQICVSRLYALYNGKYVGYACLVNALCEALKHHTIKKRKVCD